MKKVALISLVFILFSTFSAHASVDDIVINEVLYDAIGSDPGNEFIEIYNKGSEVADLSGWKIEKATASFGVVFTFPEGAMITPNNYLLVAESNIVSKNFTATLAFGNAISGVVNGVRIVSKSGEIIDELLYGTNNSNSLSDKNGVTATVFAPKVSEGHSLARIPDGNNTAGNSSDFFDVTNPTAGTENPTSTPTPTPTPTPTSTPTATPTPTSSPTPTPNPTSTPDYSAAKFLIVNEALPDPAGNDGENEFIEIKNTSDQAIDLSNFFIDDADGGSSPYKIPNDTTIEANGYLVFYSRDTKISLNNTGDKARLLYPDKTLLAEMVFGKSPKTDTSYARKDDESCAWTTEPTPGEENNFVDIDAVSSPTPTPKASTTPTPKASATPKPKTVSVTNVPKVLAVKTVKYTQKSGKTTTATPPKNTIEAKIEDLRQMSIGTRVKVRGTVSQNPGVFDQQLMYLAGSGMGIYLAQGAFPELAIGDTVVITGVLAKPSKEFFIVASKPEDISKDGAGDIPTPHKINISEITEENIGWLVSVEGEIMQKEKDHLTLRDGDKQLEILLVEEVDAKIGERVIITGIVSMTGDNLRILASGVEQKQSSSIAVRSNVKNLSIDHWKEIASTFCFCCAAVLFVYLKMGPRKVRESVA